MIKKILIPDHGTEVSNMVLVTAYVIAGPCNAQIISIHVIEVSEDPYFDI
ncbi:hypothetical protein [Candidatus Nitrosocosmicus sp. R]